MSSEPQHDREVLDRLIRLETLAERQAADMEALATAVRQLSTARDEAAGSKKALAYLLSAATAAGAIGSWVFGNFRVK